MESPIISPLLKYVSPAWPARFGGVSIFIAVLIVFLFSPSVPVYVPAISFGVMLISIFLSAETLIIADGSLETLTVAKKRILGSTNIVYPYNDIAFLCQNISTSVNQKGETIENVKYTLGLNSQTGTLPGYYRGRKPIHLPIPTSTFTILNTTLRNVQELTRAHALADFIGVPFFVNGGQNDSLVNTVETIPGYLEDIQKLPDSFAQAKKENERIAREILGDKYTS